MRFNKLQKKLILTEDEEDIFKASTPEEGVKRKQEYAKMKIKELVDSGKAKLNEDGSYDVEGSINLSEMGLTRLPVKFNKIHGSFYCYSNKLTTLEGAPKKVSENFACGSNKLTSLEGAPNEVGGHFYCNDCNYLTSLEGAPKTVGGNFWCAFNKKKFTRDEVRSVCDVKGDIYVV